MNNPDDTLARIAAEITAWEDGPDAATWNPELADADPADEAPAPTTGDLMAEMFGEVIHTYTRAQMLADEALYEADPQLCREAGIGYPVALTAAVWFDCVAWTDADEQRQRALQDQTGRLWDVLTMTRYAIFRAGRSDTASVELFRVPRGGRARRATKVRLIARCGPGDQGEPVITLMQPDES